MPAVVRIADVCSGHDACPPRAAVSGSPDVYINGRAAHRVGDAWAAHGCPDHAPHGGVLSAGSATVYVNGRPLGRIGDPVSCGSSAASGSPDVFAG